MLKVFCLLIICLINLSGCSQPKKRGNVHNNFGSEIAPLSAHNPYLGSNLYISKMMEQSRYFYNFIATQGAPLAISISDGDGDGDGDENKAQVVNLYYPNNTLFIAEAEALSENKMQWFVRGPYQSNWRYARALRYLVKDQIHEPAIHVFGEAQRFRNVSYSQGARNVRVLEPVVPPEPRIIIKEIPVKVVVTAEEEIKENKKTKKKIPVSNDPLVKLNGSAKVPLNTDQQALLISDGFVRRDSNGDVLHTVESNKEKFIAIVHWYTGSTDNTNKIKLINKQIEDIYQMPVGTLVRIPLDMIKEYKQMPIEAHVLKSEEGMGKLKNPKAVTEKVKTEIKSE